MRMPELELLGLVALTALTSYLVSVAVYRLQMRVGFVDVDAHKPGRTFVARSGGVALMLSLAASLLYWSAAGRLNELAFVYVLSAILTGFIGLIDDLRRLSVGSKLLLFCLPALLPVLLHLYDPHPYVPGVGHLRLTIVYPLMAVAAYDVAANAFNMSDTHNGLIVSAFLVFTASLSISTLMPGPSPLEGFEVLAAIYLSVVLGYLPMNMYPARMLNGNSGSHLVGSLAASLILTSRREFLAMMLLAPQILNGYLVLFTAGLKSKEAVARPTVVKSGGVITASCDPGAPITLVRLFVLERGLTEAELVKRYVALQAAVSSVSLVLYWAISLIKV